MKTYIEEAALSVPIRFAVLGVALGASLRRVILYASTHIRSEPIRRYLHN